MLAWPFLFKNYGIRDVMEFLETYGLPSKIGKYPSGATEKEKMTLLRAVMSIGRNAGGIIPHGMSIDFEAATDGDTKNHFDLVKWCEQTESKVIVGGTLLSQAMARLQPMPKVKPMRFSLRSWSSLMQNSLHVQSMTA